MITSTFIPQSNYSLYFNNMFFQSFSETNKIENPFITSRDMVDDLLDKMRSIISHTFGSNITLFTLYIFKLPQLREYLSHFIKDDQCYVCNLNKLNKYNNIPLIEKMFKIHYKDKSVIDAEFVNKLMKLTINTSDFSRLAPIHLSYNSKVSIPYLTYDFLKGREKLPIKKYIELLQYGVIEACYFIQCEVDKGLNRYKIGRSGDIVKRFKGERSYQNCEILAIFEVNDSIACETEIIEAFRDILKFTNIRYAGKGHYGREVFEIPEDRITKAEEKFAEICHKYQYIY